MSEYKGKDDCTDLILDKIIAPTESGGNYNAVIGDAHATEDLSVLTLAQIYEKQRQLVFLGRPSSAVGRYQIIRTTLETLAAELKLPDNVLFTPTLQDGLAVQLMVGRGYRAWWRDQISDTTFAHGLACEWASLPDPRNGGKSHYDGVGPNHAGRGLTEVLGLLAQAKGLRK